MKPHIIIKLNRPLSIEPPHWRKLIPRSIPAYLKSFTTAVDQIFQNNHRSFFTTAEFPRLKADWTKEEVEAGLNRIYRLVLLENTKIPDAIIQAIEILPEVEYVKIGTIGVGEISPDVSSDLTLRSGDWAREALYLDQAHLWTKGEKEIIIAVLDTGVQLSHSEFSHTLIPGYDFVDILDGTDTFIGDHLSADAIPEDEVGHGTHVAGIIGGMGRRMPKGVAPECSIMPIRVLATMQIGAQKVGAGLIDNINNGIKWAVDRGASVINMSLGVKHSGGGLPHAEVVRYALSKNTTIVAASGNDGSNATYYPGALPGVIAVGATDRSGNPADFSTWGPHISISAPGVDIYSSYIDGGYAFSTGTSHASPFVAGAIALLRSYALRYGFQLSNNQINHLLKFTADKPVNTIKNDRLGYGQINPADALRYLDNKIKTQIGWT